MGEVREIGGLTVRTGGTPPVYDPGGETWAVLGRREAGNYGAVVVQARAAGAAQVVVPDGDAETLTPLGFQPMSDFWSGTLVGSGSARVATPNDLAFMLDLSAARRVAYAAMQPVFWRPAADARARQEAWFRHLLAQKGVQALVESDGFLIAQPHAGRLLVDDFVVNAHTAWATAGRRLLTAVNGDAVVICACHDLPKRDLVRGLGFKPAQTFFQITLAI